MKGFLLLLVIAVGGAHASTELAAVSVTNCDVSPFDVFAPPCIPTLGGTVYIKLMDNATGYVVVLSKDPHGKDIKVLIVKDRKVKIGQEYRNRTEFSISTGTLKLANVEKDDKGWYDLKILTLHPSPMFVKILSFNIEIQENHPVSIEISVNVYAVLALGVILIVLIVCCVIWKLKPCRESGYQRLPGS